ncbi:MAG: SEC-C domain-containing protein [Paraglaciecola sp.]|nr:SEC-C domain-containing protein [Paraglaciecola sp.]
MKLGRNDPCPCGSGKKYKRCCMNNISKQHAELLDNVEQIVAMNPSLTPDELDVVMQSKVHERNEQPNSDFNGLSPTQMANWLYAPFNELQWVAISAPEDLSTSPVMCYLQLILDEAMQNNGSFKATSKGNLPTKLVRQANDAQPNFAVCQYQTHISISEYCGSNEDKFNALHYSRILAEIAGIIYLRSGRYHVKKTAQKQNQKQGINAFFMPMLEAATKQYNWGYFDGWEDDIDLRAHWLFMLWRLQSHGCVDQLVDEMIIAFPDLLADHSSDEHLSPSQLLRSLIEVRFIQRFLQFWGFVTVDPKRYFTETQMPRKAELQILLKQAFQFTI